MDVPARDNRVTVVRPIRLWDQIASILVHLVEYHFIPVIGVFGNTVHW
jgi:hypothetical protein